MENYYNEKINEIKRQIEDNEMDAALYNVKEELKMPYIPSSVEEELKELQKTIQDIQAADADAPAITKEKIVEYLQGTPEQQMQAVAAIFERNARNYMEEVKEYLGTNPNTSAASLLIDALIDQEIDEELTYVKDGVEYDFNPLYTDKPTESEGFTSADSYLLEWVANDNPSLYELCLQTLIHATYLYLPLVYDEDEALPLALGVLQKVCVLMGNEDLYTQITEENDLTDTKIMNIQG